MIAVAIVIVVVLLVVGAIVVLRSSTTKQVVDTTNRYDKQTCDIEARTVRTAIEAYRAMNSAYPTSIEQVTPDYLVSPPTNVTITFGNTPDTAPTYGWAGPPAVDCKAATGRSQP
ncbi:MAG: hypothetical protein U0Q22_08780 [Acidimicrobiales bacterium]